MVEMIVAVGLFAVVMMISIGALLSLVEANRRAQALQSVINNLNVAVDGMVRSLREGSSYYCGGIPSGADDTADCPEGGAQVISFMPFHRAGESASRWMYRFDETGGVGRLYKSENAAVDSAGVPVTSPDVDIESVTFYVVGSTRGAEGGNPQQPKVVIVVKGTAGYRETSRTTFHVQATAVQRLLDL